MTRILSIAAAAALMMTATMATPTTAEAKWVFPYNHPDLKWYTIETDHFYVHYPVSKRSAEDGNKHYIDATWAARKMATVSDEMWEPMCAEFDYYLTEKVHVVLLEQPDDLTGFTVPIFDFVEVSANPGASFYRTRGRMEWFADVLVHEFAHVVSLKQNAPFTEHSFGTAISGLFRDGVNNTQSGASIFIMDSDPTFWTEGGAEYWSDNSGYNWWTPSRDANIRTTVLEDRQLSCHDWLSHAEGSDYGDGERRYQQGYSFALYLRERFGPMTYNEFAEVSAERWRASWPTIIEEVTGQDMCTLHGDWLAYLQGKYGRVVDQVRAQGETAGMEIKSAPGGWEYTDPAGRNSWLAGTDNNKTKWDKVRERERAGGSYDIFAKFSDDGKLYGEFARGLITIRGSDDRHLPAVNGYGTEAYSVDETLETMDAVAVFPADWMHAWDFVPGQNKVVFTGWEEDFRTSTKELLRVESDGYNWNQIWVADLDKKWKHKRKHRGEKEEFQSFHKAKGMNKGKYAKGAFTAVPNTQRGSTPAVSPDGTRIAYLEYGSGTHNLVTINFDGTDKKYHTEFEDGSWMQVVDWSPDGKKLIVPIFRNFEQDLYVIDVATNDVKALTRDRWEVQDPHWTEDGIYFSADPTGIFNIFKLDPDTGSVTQITNIVGSAQTPHITPDGHLMFVYQTGHGWKNWALSKEEFLNKDVTEWFGTVDIDEAEVEREWDYSEDLSYWEERTSVYRPKNGDFLPIQFIPIISLENDSRTNIGLSPGLQMFSMDFVEKHDWLLYAQIGEDAFIQGRYTWQGWAPNISLVGFHGNFKLDYALQLDDDNNPETTEDQSVWDGKNHQSYSFGGVFIDYPLNGIVDFNTYLMVSQFGFKGTDDTQFGVFTRRMEGGASFNIYGGSGNWSLDMAHGFSDMVYAPYKGHDTDDGQILDKYEFNRGEVMWARRFSVPTFGLEKLAFVHDDGHRIYMSGQVGLIDRNVQSNDEFRAGAVHPMFVNYRDNRPTNTFAGYPQAALQGETVIIATAAYDFPIKRILRQFSGPLYFRDIRMRVGGTAGNLWSYKISEEAIEEGNTYFDGFGQRVAIDPKDVKREIPFVDTAYKNGNYLLTDASAELRVGTLLWGVNSFDSFARVSYGFQGIRGLNDVNGDDISDTSDPGTGNSISNEIEKPGPRFFLGIGTGW